MSEILFLAHRVPFPPDRGDKIRSHHILKALAAIAPVHVGTLGETDDDMAQEGELAAIADSFHLARRTTPLAVAGLKALASREPVSLTAFRSESLRDWVEKTLRERPIGAIYVFSGQMGQYVPADWTGRLVVDLVDVDSAKFAAYADDGSGPRAWIDAREARLLHGEEVRLCEAADHALLVSEAEARLMRSRLPGAIAADVKALGNGIDAEFFSPRSATPQPDIAATKGPHFVFSGQMDYAPNVSAVERMARRIMPAIRQVHADAAFHIVGRAPLPEVQRLDGLNGTRVWGAVPDMRPFLAAADIVVAPLTIARGVQNKVLEAMAMARPVLVTPEAATGIEAQAGVHLEIADGDEDFAASALALLADGERRNALGAAGRDYVLDHRSWPAMLEKLPALMGFPVHRELARDVG